MIELQKRINYYIAIIILLCTFELLSKVYLNDLWYCISLIIGILSMVSFIFGVCVLEYSLKTEPLDPTEKNEVE